MAYIYTYNPYVAAMTHKANTWGDLEIDLWRYYMLLRDDHSMRSTLESKEPRIVIHLKVEN